MALPFTTTITTHQHTFYHSPTNKRDVLTLQRLDNQRTRTRHNRYSRLTVLDRELDGDSETLPVTGGFGDVFTDFLGGLWI